MNASSIEPIFNASNQQIGVRVVWIDERGTQEYDISQLPGNLRTAAEVQSYMNAIVGTFNGAPQTRIGAFFGCHALTRVTGFSRGVWIDFLAAFSDERPITDADL